MIDNLINNYLDAKLRQFSGLHYPHWSNPPLNIAFNSQSRMLLITVSKEWLEFAQVFFLSDLSYITNELNKQARENTRLIQRIESLEASFEQLSKALADEALEHSQAKEMIKTQALRITELEEEIFNLKQQIALNQSTTSPAAEHHQRMRHSFGFGIFHDIRRVTSANHNSTSTMNPN